MNQVELEIQALFAQMSEEAEADRLAGKLDPESVEQAIREHRKKHSYQQLMISDKTVRIVDSDEAIATS